jgi:uncharacterized protein
MNLYLCSDLHENFAKFPKENVDAIICAGDMTNFGAKVEYKKLTQWLDKCQLLAPTFYLPGNHDIGLKDSQLTSSGALNIYHRTALLNELSLYGVSLSVYYKAPGLALPWDNVTCDPMVEGQYYSQIPPCDILVSHSPPSGSLGTEKVCGDIGSSCLRSWIERFQPKLVVCGHVHNPMAREEMIGRTKVVNVATKPRIVYLEESTSGMSYVH